MKMKNSTYAVPQRNRGLDRLPLVANLKPGIHEIKIR